jgi:hypothetical protein
MDLLSELKAARRTLFLGIGGGGDVAGAFAVSRAVSPTEAVIGGISWERRIFDELAGPRAICELTLADPIARCAALVGPHTLGPGGLVLSESRMSQFLGKPVLLIDPGEGTSLAAEAISAAASHMGCDAVVLVDVGGDVLASGHEPHLVSPLADAVMLATSAWLTGEDVLLALAVMGIGCDGELSPDEGEMRLARIAAMAPLQISAIPRAEISELERAAQMVGSGTTALALRCAKGERGRFTLRDGKQVAELTDLGADIYIIPAHVAMGAAPLAQAVVQATSIEDAHERLQRQGVRTTGLGYEGELWTAPQARRAARARP